MPYINAEAKTRLDDSTFSPNTAGELNYMITKMCIKYANKMGRSYQTYNDIMGALEGCKLELYRRRIAKYEDAKMIENGDVYYA